MTKSAHDNLELRRELSNHLIRLSKIKYNQLIDEIGCIYPNIVGYYRRLKLPEINETHKDIIIKISDRLFYEKDYEFESDIELNYRLLINDLLLIYKVILRDDEYDLFKKSVGISIYPQTKNIHYLYEQFELFFGVTVDETINTYHTLINECNIKYSSKFRVINNDGYYIKQFILNRLLNDFNLSEIDKLINLINDIKPQLLTDELAEISKHSISNLYINDAVFILNLMQSIKPFTKKKNNK